MYFTKYPHRANFSFVTEYDPATGTIRAGERDLVASITSYEGDIYHVAISHSATWDGNASLEDLVVPASSDRQRLSAGPGLSLSLLGKSGQPILQSLSSESFGVCGGASMFQFQVGNEARFYGMGEKTFNRLELSGIHTKFWNTDVWGDFHGAQATDHPTDPPYVSIPYLIVKVGDEYVGLLLHNPYATFMETPSLEGSNEPDEYGHKSKCVVIGSEDGEPNLWVIYGPTLRELTQKLQKLVGVTPVPPIWGLGYHQCRWGYGGHDDLVRMDAEFEKHQIPCDGLWMDLEHMRGYRIFNTSEDAFPGGAQVTADVLAKNNRKIVPILDPGVKFEKGLGVYDDGHAKDLFCHNAEGKEFVGLVWPGETVFPDFTMPETRSWWAGYVKSWTEEGFAATWVDMNDPSTGWVDPQGMLFHRGTHPHRRYHNQYALGMQQATWDGFLLARPNERPFVISRSGCTGTSKFAGVWSGDNVSNYFYLKTSIPEALGMSLSGLPLNGPDMGGFGGDCSEELMVDWVKTDFLFPFCRNHSVKGSQNQEPFAYSKPAMEIIRRYIRLRYKLLPYLYNLFIQEEAIGEAVMRPLIYEFNDSDIDAVSDQFLVGPSIMQAPFVEERAKTRTAILPGTEPWYDARSGQWEGPGTVTLRADRSETPLFVRAGSIIPMQRGTPTDNSKDLVNINLHLFLPVGWSGESEYTCFADDGISYDYRSGARSELVVRVVSVDGNLAIVTEQTATGFGPIEATFVIHGEAASIRLNGAEATTTKDKVVLTGGPLTVWVVR